MRAAAAIDLGTSRLKVAGFIADDAPAFSVIADARNEVRLDGDGAATCRWSTIAAALDGLLDRLGAWCRARGVDALDLGLCGHVSSVLRWDAQRAAPVADDFPIWMDATCRGALGDAEAVLGERAVERLGTRLPAMTNWLAVKLIDQRARGGVGDALVLQVADAALARLTGEIATHPTAQISLVHQVDGGYAPAILDACGVTPANLPRLAPREAWPLRDDVRARHGLPPTRVCAGLQDTNATMLGLAPEDGDGLWLTGTSEILGVVERAPRATPPARLVRARLDDGWAVYGSSLSGGATIAWLLRDILRDESRLAELTARAAAVPAGCDGLVCLPYVAGERAPLWDPRWLGAFVGLRAHHGDAHLLRAAMEGVCLARAQTAAALERPLPARFLLGGGAAANALWNRIRASVLGRPLARDPSDDLALVGALRHALRLAGRGDDERALTAALPAREAIAPEAAWAGAYADAARRFARAQRALAPEGAYLP